MADKPDSIDSLDALINGDHGGHRDIYYNSVEFFLEHAKDRGELLDLAREVLLRAPADLVARIDETGEVEPKDLESIARRLGPEAVEKLPASLEAFKALRNQPGLSASYVRRYEDGYEEAVVARPTEV